MKRPTLSIGIPLCLLFLCIVIIPGSAGDAIRSQSAESLHNYRGAIGNIPIGMTLVSDRLITDLSEFAGKVTGTYFYVKWLKDIDIRGTVDDERNFVFYEYDKAGNITGSFKGRFSKPDNEELIGTWFRPDGTGGQPFHLAQESITSRVKGKGRYFDSGVEDDEAFEKIVQQFRKAVIIGNKQVVADLINYPIGVAIAGKKRALTGRADVIANYDRIFSHSCVEAIRGSVPHNMFANIDGVMFDNGVIWFGADGKVIAINCN